MPYSNLLLASLSEADAAFLSPHLKPVRLASQEVPFETGDTIDRVCFPNVVTLSTGEMIEAAMVGRDSIVGAAAATPGAVGSIAAYKADAGPGVGPKLRIAPMKSLERRSVPVVSGQWSDQATLPACAR